MGFDDDLARRWPLPLAQLYRRAHNAKTAFDRQQTAYYLWEAGLRLLAAAAAAGFAERIGRDAELAGAVERDAELAAALGRLGRPSVGDLWGLVRRLVATLAEAGDPGFAAVNDVLLGGARDDLPRAAELDAVLRDALGTPAAGSRRKVRVGELFDRLVQYRNREIGHGAAARRPAAFYERLAGVLLPGLAELFGRLDVLGGRRLVYVEDVRMQKSGQHLVERFALAGESARRVESLGRPAGDPAGLPWPEQVYLEDAGGPEAGTAPAFAALRPLVAYDPVRDEVIFLNARRGRTRCEYLSYITGDHPEREEPEADEATALGRLLARLAGAPGPEAPEAENPSPAHRSGSPAAAGGARPPRFVGEFELLSELGRGGMGIVYRAWQPSLDRQVALKVVGHADDPKARARFRREMRALGRVDHPHLVKIFTAGFDDEPCHFSMELVEGATLDAVYTTLQTRSTSAVQVDLGVWRASLSTACDETRRAEKPLSDPGGEPPPPGGRTPVPAAALPAVSDRSYVRQVVDLIRQVALAAHTLHEAGVVHRDIKPGNIMVAADGSQAVLMDLGLAQLADDVEGRLTKTRHIVGTLRYASPEQVMTVGELDRRSDVYSLGATLWELLTLRPLYGADDRMPDAELIRRITWDEPDRLRRHHPGIASDLEAIVFKCLEKRPERRYNTAAELAEDLARWQRGEYVTAQPLTTRYVLGKFVRRHRVAIAATLALVLAGLAGTAAAFYSVDRARREAIAQRNRADRAAGEALRSKEALQVALREAEAQRNEARAQHGRAEANFRQARGAVDDLLTKVSESKLLDVPGMQPLRKELLQAALKYYQGFASQAGDDPELKAELAAAYHRVGEITELIGGPGEAIAAFEKAAEIRQGLADAAPGDAARRRDLARTVDTLGAVYRETGKVDRAQELHRRAVALRERLAGERPGDAGLRADLAESVNNLGLDYRAAGQEARAEESFARAVAIRKEAADKAPGLPTLTSLVQSLVPLAMAKHNDGRLDQAETSLRELSGALEKAAGQGPPDEDLKNLVSLTRVMPGLMRGSPEAFTQAESGLDKLLASAEAFVRQNPNVTSNRVTLATMYSVQGGLLARNGKGARAEEFYDKAVAIEDELVREHPDVPAFRNNLAGTLNDLGNLHRDSGRRDKALAAHERAMALRQELVREHPESAEYRGYLAWSYYNIGRIHAAAGRRDRAEQLYRKALPLCEALAREHPGDLDRRKNLAWTYSGLAHIHRNAGRWAEALEFFEKAGPLYESLAREMPGDVTHRTDLAWTDYYIGVVDHALGREDPSRDAVRKAVDDLGRIRDNERSGKPAILTDLAISLLDWGRPAEAEPLLRRAVALRRQEVPPRPADLANALSCHGWALLDLGRSSEAEPLLREALEIRGRILPERSWATANTRSLLGSALAAEGRFEEAGPLLLSSYATLAAARDAPPARVRQAITRVIRYYEAHGPASEAEAWRVRRLDLDFPADPFAR